MNGRELRLWHWRRAQSAHATAESSDRFADLWEQANPGRRCGSERNRAQANYALSDFHLRAAHTLNDHPHCVAAGTPAEQDDAMFTKPHSRKKKR